jgi:hypothetical protein
MEMAVGIHVCCYGSVQTTVRALVHLHVLSALRHFAFRFEKKTNSQKFCSQYCLTDGTLLCWTVPVLRPLVLVRGIKPKMRMEHLLNDTVDK